jgi:trimethylamine:corrinoid methyltransferase-like protein
LSLEQIVVDNELVHWIQRLAEGVDCSNEKDYFEDVLKIGPGGHFLGTKRPHPLYRDDGKR